MNSQCCAAPTSEDLQNLRICGDCKEPTDFYNDSEKDDMAVNTMIGTLAMSFVLTFIVAFAFGYYVASAEAARVILEAAR